MHPPGLLSALRTVQGSRISDLGFCVRHVSFQLNSAQIPLNPKP